MKAAVSGKPGSPNVIEYLEVEDPKVPENWVLIAVKAFGLNRSEMFTRQGHSPHVKFPIIQGIECVGVVKQDDSGKFNIGQ